MFQEKQNIWKVHLDPVAVPFQDGGHYETHGRWTQVTPWRTKDL